jgi:hypothetical protein
VLVEFPVFVCDITRYDYPPVAGNTASPTKLIMSNTTETIAKVRKSRIRESVLLKVTASKLADLIGDAEIGVSRKELRALVLSKSSNDVLANAGL